jgi:MFS family permease
MSGRSEGRNLTLFYVGNVCFGAGLIVHAFAFNFYLRELGYSAAVMGDQVTAMTLGGLAALLPAGLLVDRAGARPAMITGVVLATAGLVAGALMRERALIQLTAAAVGAGAATCRVTWGPALMRLASPGARSRAFTWNVALLMGSAAAWNALAGAVPSLVSRVGTVAALSGNQLVLIGSALVTLLAAPCYWALHFSVPPVAAAATDRRILLRKAAEMTARAAALPVSVHRALAFTAMFMLSDALVSPFLNIYFTDRFALPVATVGTLFAVALAVRAVVLGGAAEVARHA